MLCHQTRFSMCVMCEMLFQKQKIYTHLHTLAVIEQHVAELFGHHVQVSLLALVGPCQNIELGEVG